MFACTSPLQWCVQDQYDKVGEHTQKGIDFCEKFTHFLKERSAVELDYARSLK